MMINNLIMTMSHQVVKEAMMTKKLTRTKTIMRIRRGKIPKEKKQTKTYQTSLTALR